MMVSARSGKKDTSLWRGRGEKLSKSPRLEMPSGGTVARQIGEETE